MVVIPFLLPIVMKNRNVIKTKRVNNCIFKKKWIMCSISKVFFSSVVYILIRVWIQSPGDFEPDITSTQQNCSFSIFQTFFKTWLSIATLIPSFSDVQMQSYKYQFYFQLLWNAYDAINTMTKKKQEKTKIFRLKQVLLAAKINEFVLFLDALY